MGEAGTEVKSEVVEEVARGIGIGTTTANATMTDIAEEVGVGIDMMTEDAGMIRVEGMISLETTADAGIGFK